MKAEYRELLRKLGVEFEDILSIDGELLARLQNREIITRGENQRVRARETDAERIVLLFEEILAQKDDSVMESLGFILRDLGKVTVADFFQSELANIKLETLPSSSTIAPGSSSSRFFLRLKTSFVKPYKKDVRSLAGAMKEFYLGPYFTDISIMPFDPVYFKIDQMWVNLEMRVPSGVKEWERVKDYRSSLEKSALDRILVLLKGEAGIGKSTLAKRLCHDWATGVAFQSYDLVLVCRLREATDAKTIPGMVLKWVEESVPKMKAVIGRLADSMDDMLSKFNVLFLLDGWDEDVSRCEELQNLLKRTRELEYGLIVTTRPFSAVPGAVRFHLYQILGLTDSNKFQFIDKFFRYFRATSSSTSSHSNEVKAANLRQQLEEKRHLEEMGRIPLLLAYICSVDAAASARNKTELYLIVIEWMIRRCEEKNLSQCPSFEEDWKGDERVLELGRLALEGLLEKDETFQLIFKEKLLKDRIAPEMFQIGLLNRENTREIFRNSYNISFAHKTVQEFLAALVLHSDFNAGLDPFRDFPSPTSNEERASALRETTVFLVGLVTEAESGNLKESHALYDLIEKLKEIDLDEDPHLKECLFEEKWSTVFKSKLEKMTRLEGSVKAADFIFISKLAGDKETFGINLRKTTESQLPFTPRSIAYPTQNLQSQPELNRAELEGDTEPGISTYHVLDNPHRESCGFRIDYLHLDDFTETELIPVLRSVKSLESLHLQNVTLSSYDPGLSMLKIVAACPEEIHFISLKISSSQHQTRQNEPFHRPSDFHMSPEMIKTVVDSHHLLRSFTLDSTIENPELLLDILAKFPMIEFLNLNAKELEWSTFEETIIPRLKKFPCLTEVKLKNTTESMECAFESQHTLDLTFRLLGVHRLLGVPSGEDDEPHALSVPSLSPGKFMSNLK